NVIVNGTAGNDSTIVSGSTAAGVTVSGLVPSVKVMTSESALDKLTVNSLGGADVVNASTLASGAIGLILNGGALADVLLGSAGGDQLVGGPGDDLALAGAGDDTFVWNPGDGNDTLEGQAGTDALLFNGANIAENIDVSANGGRVRFLRNVAT